ncbi:spore coat protein GerQ [Lentibacillus salicampi]|uniref:Spore coat protein GerQ n=1 Tax=Lentibacillus salicampi TaxID=175306 RepID=A0A4Y9ABY9_9BACI|nr:spore coat protein GerQ [Lentibacillus salicampi]TFJ93408.1 spore coat protein GerQ [Lentibacillus salicampi]
MSEQDHNGNYPYGSYYQAYPYFYYPQSSPAYYPVYDPRQDMQNQPPQQQAGQGMLPEEQSYIENILRLNEGKQATVYMTFENNAEWNAKVFRGVIEAAGRDHIILRDPQSGKRYLLLMIYLDYITFDEELNYQYPYGNDAQMAQYPPR